MRVGDVIDRRFLIERLASSGGMGDVYRACDLVTNEPVALKVLQRRGLQEAIRFAREVEALEALTALRHPGIVRYIAHGATDAGQPYLAMEWLAGETLTERLNRRSLTIAESVALASRIASTLGVVHRAGIVHRDLKPSNLLLVGGAIEGVTLIDFGVVRLGAMDRHLTMPGTMLGTPGYMAPEQARSEPNIDPRADVFSLGCVLFKCLTGRSAFQGADGLSVLIKVILEDPPRLRELRGDVPEALDDLVARMLAKPPKDRPRDGDAVAAELLALDDAGVGAASSRPSNTLRGGEITTNERKMMCLVLARDASGDAEATRSQEEDLERSKALIAVAERYQGELEILESRSPLIVLTAGGAPTDLAAQSARCALALNALLGSVPVALVTGRAEMSARLPVGELIDRAVHLLPPAHAPAGADAVRMDEVTAGLLGARFDVTREAGALRLYGEREELASTPPLLGKPTPCVGRDRELALLEAAFSHCVEESTPSAVLVTAPAGAGKSRLRSELIRRLRDRGEDLEVWIGRGDPMSAGSAFALLAPALRRAIGLFEGEPIEARQRKLRARVARYGHAESARTAAFLGELIGVPFPDGDSVQLMAARRSPVLMSDQIRVAWEELLRAECSARPVLLVLEDLHWGDLPSVLLVDSALRNLGDQRLMVLALGRPEVRELFPKLWAGRGVHEVQLSGLPRRASERLVRQVLGEDVAPELLAMIVDRADGNAFYLEEQLRAVADGKGADLPETVVAMVQARIEALDIEARRALRAASVFGQTFWQGGVSALVGGAQVAPKLVELEQREVISRRGEGSLPGEVEYSFQHAIVREAAYGMLTEGDRRLGHRLAGEWLSRAGAGAVDAMALGEHFERGGELSRAAAAYCRAAEQALRAQDLAAAIERAERGVACGPNAQALGALRLVEAEAHVWRGELALAEQRGTEAVDRLPAGSAAWFSAIKQVAMAAGKLGGFERVERWMSAAQAAAADAEGALVAKHMCLGEGALLLVFGGRYAFADALIEAIEGDGTDLAEREVEVVARLHAARSARALGNGDPSACLAGLSAALAAFERAGDRGNACAFRMNVGYMHAELGDFAGAEEVLRSALSGAERMGLHDLAVATLSNLGHVLGYRGRIEEAERTEREAIALSQRLGDPRTEGSARTYLARIALLARDFEGAEQEARAAAEILQSAPPLRAAAVAARARALLGLGRFDEALSAAGEAFSMLNAIGAIEEGESAVRNVYAEALAANGMEADCAAAIAAARERLMERAGKISDPVWRERFLTIPENQRTLEMAARWGGPSA
ncbi:serine/threonine-protein kinase [Sorangium atrum]|uniref:Protein kinase n=1 Tax=Sorangium atrum TaxID=2995308 RepID=A0ABT5BTC4_9BACT|nr:serine/threonine-protein kinase [Sorangium aterium]MDC0676799.1 protein kinase [Sorangium aterium]